MAGALNRMTPEDLTDVLTMEQEAFGKMAWHENDFFSAITSDYDYPLVIRSGGHAVAYCVLRILGPEAEIENICVHPAFRKNGLGDLMMDEMIRLSLEQKASQIFLEVRTKNMPARSLYEKKGFRESYVRKNYYIDPSDDALIMTRICSDGSI